MKMSNILWALVLGGTLAVAGCGDNQGGDNPLDPGPDNTGGTGGMTGTGGSGTGGMTGASSDTCEAICNSECFFQGINPEGNQCLTSCQVGLAQFDDDGCGPQADAYLSCIAAFECNPEVSQCQSEAIAWGTCLAL